MRIAQVAPLLVGIPPGRYRGTERVADGVPVEISADRRRDLLQPVMISPTSEPRSASRRRKGSNGVRSGLSG